MFIPSKPRPTKFTEFAGYWERYLNAVKANASVSRSRYRKMYCL